MLGLAAAALGYRVIVYSPQSRTPAGDVAFAEVSASYEDEEALGRFARAVDVVTVEFENIPATALEFLERTVPVRPGPQALYLTQNRGREKEFLKRQGLPHARTVRVPGPADLDRALESTGTPAVLKTAGFGYDGKGQLLIAGEAERQAARELLASGPGVLEEYVEFQRELSVLVARSPSGELRCFGPIENRHSNHILDVSSVPADIPPGHAEAAFEIARQAAIGLDLQGLACVELFETEDGRLLVNEIAPRPHNSGHLTIEACLASQFEQQLRAVCDLPLADMELRRPAAMANLLGDLWVGGEPAWQKLLGLPGIALHLYGKAEARPGRKMGHLTALAETAEAAVAAVREARGIVATEQPNPYQATPNERRSGLA